MCVLSLREKERQKLEVICHLDILEVKNDYWRALNGIKGEEKENEGLLGEIDVRLTRGKVNPLTYSLS